MNVQISMKCQSKKRIPTMSFDLMTSELDNHPFIRTMCKVNHILSFGWLDDVGVPALFR